MRSFADDVMDERNQPCRSSRREPMGSFTYSSDLLALFTWRGEPTGK